MKLIWNLTIFFSNNSLDNKNLK